jgi:hypothetical protein
MARGKAKVEPFDLGRKNLPEPSGGRDWIVTVIS